MAVALPFLCLPLWAAAQEVPPQLVAAPPPPPPEDQRAEEDAGPRMPTAQPERLQATMERLCEQPRLAGSIESHAAIEFAAEVFEQAGLEVQRTPYWCYLPRQTAQSLQVRQSDGSWAALDLREFGYEVDGWSMRDHQAPMHGLTAPGTAEGQLWYVGYGTENEFNELRRKYGNEFEGGIALVRYGALYRGLKVANAEDFGFAGALLYTDRDDDGASKGDVLPKGPWRPTSGIQRGSVYNADGDPLTPGWAALENATRLHPEQAPGLVHIPSMPVSSGNAAILMAGEPRRLGPLPTTARIHIEQDPNLVEIQNVFGRIEGSTHPDEWVIFGAHRDAWGFGATDNGTGSTVLLETARLAGEAMQQGWRPQRTLIFATWDAEEWGLVGSTEWVEQYRAELMQHAVAYVNLDVAATGPNFNASCTPGMAASVAANCEAMGIPVPKRLGVPGGGSDHVPFLELAGIEVLGFGFHGGSGVYHSALDTPFLIGKFLDPGYRHHAQAANYAFGLAQRLAVSDNAVDGSANWVEQILEQLDRLPEDNDAALIAKLKLQRAALRLALRQKDASAPSSDASVRDGFRFHRAFLPTEGRSLLWRTAGYGADWFPVLKEALAGDLESGEWKEALKDLLEGFERAG
ncbi:MAG: M28 family peptidase [Planctomycetota bacterium]